MNLSKGYLLALVTIFAYLSWQLVVPFLQYVLLAVLLAFVLFPLQKRLEGRISPAISAFLLVGLAIVGFIIPFVLVAAVIAEDAADLLQEADPETLQFAEIEELIEEETGMEVNLTATLADSAEQIGSIVLEQATAWFSAVTHALIGLGLALFLLYYLLKSGDDLLAWIREITPLPSDVQDDLYDELDEVMWAVLAGHVLIAIIEGVVAGLALFAVGIPNAAFWTFVMVILSLVPLIGAPLVWGPAAIYLVLIGEPVLAGALAVYSAIVVGVADDYLRPIVVDRYAEISPAVIILGVLGGIYAFGIMGLFFGPVVVGALIAILEVVDDNYDRLGGESGTT
ncbi:AI-2E family transporter [Natronococcus pandeyae]|uniref:AI-2E family transporter n=1 Tax=Natronococcus pandeyae TaxID=2055836 RepID=A0A8J8TTC4_9EURY|nr:AI-2E family transporter [Natronococcus pandeyae]TYL40045.1 AI-2E family transporter [Natronococcus pandeyae]